VPLILFGNKADLEEEREVSTVEAKNLASEWGIPFLEGSAKNNKNVKEVFHNMVKDIRTYKVKVAKLKNKNKKAPKKGLFDSSGADTKDEDLAAFS
jgi:GTPase SAR1 family protein